MAKTKRQQQTQEQKLLDAVTYASSRLKEAGEPLLGLGPNQRYLDAFNKYGDALYALVKHATSVHPTDWSWDGYEGHFNFRWDFGFRAAQPGATYEHDARFVEMSCRAHFDPSKSLNDEVQRLQAEASHYDEMRGAMMRWAAEERAKSLVVPSAERAS
jgi:hypothetical protein